MIVSETEFMSKEFGTTIIESWDLEPLLYN